MKVLLAVDGSPCSDKAVDEVGRRPWPAGSEIKVLTTYELPVAATPEGWTVPPTYYEELDRVASEHARSIMERAVSKLTAAKAADVSISGQTAPGPPRSLILDEAQSWGADLIVLGSHGYGALERFLLGSVSQSVVAHAKCSTEVVRCPSGPTTKEATIAKGK